MRVFWQAAGHFYAMRAWANRRAAIRRYLKARDLNTATVRLLCSYHRYDAIKKTSEKFFRKAGRGV